MSDEHEYEDDEAADFEATDWRQSNHNFQAMSRLCMRTEDVAHGRIKAVFAYGPPGIAKTFNVLARLRLYAYNMRKLWEQSPEDMREAPGRRSRLVEGIEEFKIPFVRCHGKITPIMLYIQLSRFSESGEVVVCDDLENSKDPAVQSLFSDACDREADYRISWNTFRGEMIAKIGERFESFPTETMFEGGLINITNLRPSQAFQPRLRDRVVKVAFSWKRSDVAVYVDRMAFTPREDTGLWRILIGKASGPPHARGLGFSGTHAQAAQLLDDVRKAYHAHYAQIETIGFRFLVKVLTDRLHRPDIWRSLIVDHLRDAE